MRKLLELVEKAKGITCDSRQVKPGYIFVAILGRATDGNRFAAAAAQNGAIAVVTENPAGLPPLNITVVTVPDAREALAELAAAFYRHPSQKLALTGVTGTNGKTTVTFMLEHIFRQACLQAGLIGTVCVKNGKDTIASTLTTPDAATLQGYLADMHSNNVACAAMEVSAQGLELKRVHKVAFACGILTNISPDHLDLYGDFEKYLAAKKNFPALLGQAPLIINNDDPYCRNIALAHSGPVITAGITSAADIITRITRLNKFGSYFQLAWNRALTTVHDERLAPGSLLVKLSLPGRHNIENAAMAAAAALILGIPAPVINRALATFAPVPRRMVVSRLEGVTVVDDTALNPGSIDAVFNTISTFRYRQLILINAIRGCRGTVINTANANTLACWWRRQPFSLIVTAASGSVGSADYVQENEKSAFLKALIETNTSYLFTDTLPEAVETALATASPGDLLLLLGAQGMDDGYRILRQKAAMRQNESDCAFFEPTGVLI